MPNAWEVIKTEWVGVYAAVSMRRQVRSRDDQQSRVPKGALLTGAGRLKMLTLSQ